MNRMRCVRWSVLASIPIVVARLIGDTPSAIVAIRKNVSKAVIFSLIPYCMGSSGYAQDINLKRMVFYTGKCRLQLIEGFFPCDDKVVYSLLKNGRTLIVFMKGEHMFTVVGGADRQPNLENYYVSIDKLIINKDGKKEAEDPNMEGECHMNMNKEATKFNFIRCDVYNRAKGNIYNFYLEHIRSFDRKEF